MYYYEVNVTDIGYKKSSPLTYCSTELINTGTVVSVNVRSKECLAYVYKKVDEPSFKAKPINRSYDNLILPKKCIESIQQISKYYPSSKSTITQLFLPTHIQKYNNKDATDFKKPQIINEINLSAIQKSALKEIKDSKSSVLLHGQTGSGKTLLYIQRAKEIISQGQNVLILVPEIALIPQTASTFRSQLGAEVASYSSEETPKTKSQIWHKLSTNTVPMVIVGTRSALFLPYQTLGLIVIDECHETGYKNETAPYYNASQIAAILAKTYNSQIIRGSATPSISDYYYAQAKGLTIIKLASHAANDSKRTIKIISLKDKSEFSTSSLISKSLATDMKQTLKSGKQVLLFLNRRGSARLVICDTCAWTAECDRCSTPLVYHGDAYKLKCHTCDQTQKTPLSCPSCRAMTISFRVLGTKSIVTEISKQFPNAKIARFDTDNSVSESMANNYTDIESGKVNIIIGTQMVAKGLDLPNLELIGIINADTSLLIPDYTSSEKTYQLINQVIGRVGRIHGDGKVIIQTYNPESNLIDQAVNDNWDDFYNTQISERQEFNLPPFTFTLKITCARSLAKSAEQTLQKLVTTLRSKIPKIHIQGPTPSFKEKQRGQYHYQLIISAKNRQSLIDCVQILPSKINFDIDPVNFL